MSAWLAQGVSNRFATGGSASSWFVVAGQTKEKTGTEAWQSARSTGYKQLKMVRFFSNLTGNLRRLRPGTAKRPPATASFSVLRLFFFKQKTAYEIDM